MTDAETLARKQELRKRMAEIDTQEHALWSEKLDLSAELMQLGGCGSGHPAYAHTCVFEDDHDDQCSSRDNMPG